MLKKYLLYGTVCLILVCVFPSVSGETYQTNFTTDTTGTDSNGYYLGYVFKVNVVAGGNVHYLYNVTMYAANAGYDSCHLWNATTGALIKNVTATSNKCTFNEQIYAMQTYFISYSAAGTPHTYTRENTVVALNGRFINVTSGGYKTSTNIPSTYVNGWHLETLTAGTVPASPPSNTCTYSTGDWTINNNDDCNITSTVTMSAGSTLTLNGTGGTTSNRLYVTGSIKGFSTFKTTGTNTLFWGNIG